MLILRIWIYSFLWMWCIVLCFAPSAAMRSSTSVHHRNVKAHSSQTSGNSITFQLVFCIDASVLVPEFFSFFAGVNDDSAQEDELKQWQKHAKVTETCCPSSSWFIIGWSWSGLELKVSLTPSIPPPPFFSLFFSLQDLKLRVLEQVQEQLSDILDKALIENNPPFIQKQLTKNGTAAPPSSRSGGAD